MTIACQLCGSTDNKRGRSHIAPAAFFREIKRRGGGLLIVSRDGTRKIKHSKDGPKDHKILCLKCESNTSKIDDYGVGAFLGNKFQFQHIFSKKQRFAGHSDCLDGKKLKLFFIFTLLKASWSKVELYAHFTLPAQIENAFREYVLAEYVDDMRVLCFLLHRQPTVKNVPGSPEVHNGAVSGVSHKFGQSSGMLYFYHILEFTALVFVRDVPCNDPLPNGFIKDKGRVTLLRSHAINERLDNAAFDFMRDRLQTEAPAHAV